VKVAFLLPDFSLSGGAGIVVQHARQLSLHHGFEVVLVRTKVPTGREWSYSGLGDVRTADVFDVLDEEFDVAVATWWETAISLFDLRASRYAYFLQLFENSHYEPGAPETPGFALTVGLPVRYLTAARWIRDLTEQLQPGSRSHYVRSGMDKSVWAVPDAIEPAVDGPLRIVIEGSLSLYRKGTPHAVEAVRLMREPHHVTLVTPEPPEGGTVEGVDVVTGALPHPELAALFGASHVLLKLSRAEGMYGPPLEGFHCGCTVVTNPVTGHDDYIVHDENGLVVDWDDPVGTARALDLLARDRVLLHRLRLGALETARAWPDWEQASTFMAGALRAIASEPPPSARSAGQRLAHEIGQTVFHTERVDMEVTRARRDLNDLRAQRAIRAALLARRYATPALRAAKRFRPR
jgi:glycosyltransferase involved in cell wall biosynthesis